MEPGASTPLGIEVRVSMVRNDEGNIRCSACGRGGWWQALQFIQVDELGWSTFPVTLCLHRYEGQSCAELAKVALFQTNIPGGTFTPVEVR